MVQQRSRPTSATATGTVASHVTALDGLRGLAIAGVLLFHTGNLQSGFLGVDLFFVLSGFLITGVLLREITTRRGVSLKRFWGRRLRRLFPALAALLLVTSVVTWWLQRSDAVMSVTHELVRTTLSDGLWVQMNLANWHLLAQDASYWEAFGQPRLFGHLWSIAVEEQFYVVWPSLLMVFVAVISRVKGRRRSLDANTLGWTVIALCAVLAAVSQLLMVLLLDGGDPTRVYTGTDTRAFSLLLGAAAATEPARRLFDAVFHALGKAAGALMTLLAAVMLGSWAVVDGTDFPGLFTGGSLRPRCCCRAPHRTVRGTAARRSQRRSCAARSPVPRAGVAGAGLVQPLPVALAGRRAAGTASRWVGLHRPGGRRVTGPRRSLDLSDRRPGALSRPLGTRALRFHRIRGGQRCPHLRVGLPSVPGSAAGRGGPVVMPSPQSTGHVVGEAGASEMVYSSCTCTSLEPPACT